MRPNDRTARLAMTVDEALAQPLAPAAFGLSTSHITGTQISTHNVSRETPSPEQARAALDELNRRRDTRRLLARAGETRQGQLEPHPPAPYAVVYRGGSLLRLRFPNFYASPPGHRRGQVCPYLSANSRRAILRFMARIDLTAIPCLPLFITLTYPGEYNENPKQWKNDLTCFLQRLIYRFPDAAGVWRLEPQKRGAPHYHLLVFNARFIHYAWVATEWSAVVARRNTRYIHLHTRTERVYSYNGVLAYAAKYISKSTELDKPLNWGRWWGIFNRAKLPVTENVIPLTVEQFYMARRAARDILARDGHTIRDRVETTGLTIFLRYGSAMSLLGATATMDTQDNEGNGARVL